MTQTAARPRALGAANRDAPRPIHEPATAQIASFVELFVWLLVLRGFFLPLFQIPTGSMAETLMGAYATHTCRNCAFEYPVGFHQDSSPVLLECPNCRWQETTIRHKSGGVLLNDKAGDRIVVHGWPYLFGGPLGPERWDVVVFRNPNDAQQNYIKRLVGLPGETIEIVDGDIWVTPPGVAIPRLARKTQQTQSALWFTRYDHDYIPKNASTDHSGVDKNGQRYRAPEWQYFKPRWVQRGDGTAWKGLESRTPEFDGVDKPTGSIIFVTDADGTQQPGLITDIYGYNGFYFEPYQILHRPYNTMSDVRLSTDVELFGGTGHVELGISKNNDLFFARLTADGQLTLEHENRLQPGREQWGPAVKVPLSQKPVRLSIGHADYEVVVEVNSRRVLVSTQEQYPITQDLARERGVLKLRPTITISAEKVRARLAHVRIDRDVYYTSERHPGIPHPLQAVEGNPIKLREDAYLVFGDNSTASQDSRYWMPPPEPGEKVHPGQPYLGGHLHERYRRDVYEVGTVPADQMIGQAFLVYWPGFLPVFPHNPRIPDFMIDFGRVRWIH